MFNPWRACSRATISLSHRPRFSKPKRRETYRNCHSHVRSNLNSSFHRLYYVNWQLNLIKSLWLNEFISRQIWWSQSRPYSNEIVNDCPIKNSNNFFCFRKSNDIITINKLKDLTFKEKEFSHLVLNEKMYSCRYCKFKMGYLEIKIKSSSNLLCGFCRLFPLN